MITVETLSVTFQAPTGPVRAVDDVSFMVEAGEAFGLVGESGSGKSTVLRALAGLFPHWTGSLLIDGNAQRPKRDKAFFAHVQMVFQDPYGSLHPRHTIDRILAEPCAIHGVRDVERRILTLLDAVGLPRSFRFRFPHQLSGGQRQRVAIARALILEPRVLLLDEPTSALDVSIQAEILNLLADLRVERGLTYLLVSHDLAVVGHLCDRLAVMRQGRIVETTTVAGLASGTVAHPYTRQLLAASAGYDRALATDLLAEDQSA